jgi:hypothetical protein
MKQQAIQYVALDVHQATVVVSVRDEQGSIVMRATVATEAKAIVGLVRGLGPRVHVAFEEGTQAQCPRVSRRRRVSPGAALPGGGLRACVGGCGCRDALRS